LNLELIFKPHNLEHPCNEIPESTHSSFPLAPLVIQEMQLEITRSRSLMSSPLGSLSPAPSLRGTSSRGGGRSVGGLGVSPRGTEGGSEAVAVLANRVSEDISRPLSSQGGDVAFQQISPFAMVQGSRPNLANLQQRANKSHGQACLTPEAALSKAGGQMGNATCVVQIARDGGLDSSQQQPLGLLGTKDENEARNAGQ